MRKLGGPSPQVTRHVDEQRPAMQGALRRVGSIRHDAHWEGGKQGKLFATGSYFHLAPDGDPAPDPLARRFVLRGSQRRGEQ